MQLISVRRLLPGMRVGRNVYNAEGKILIASEVRLTVSYIKRLTELGVGSIYIVNEQMPKIEIPEIVREQTRVKAIQTIKNIFPNLSVASKLHFQKFTKIAASIVKEILGKNDTMLHLTDIRTYDDYTFAHSVNVCVLSVLLGTCIKEYDENQLKELALGALLHDVGKTLIPREILNKPGALTTAEYIMLQDHAALGFEILRKQQDVIPLLVSHVAYQHQEWVDGSGYPRKLKGEEIHEYARIVAIADVYDALTSSRPYRKGLLPHEAFEIMMASGGTHFDISLLYKFFNRIAIYPAGSFLRLTTGEIGIVSSVKPEFPTRPVVEILIDKNGNRLEIPFTIDMTKQLTVFINKVYNEEECQQLQRVLVQLPEKN